MGPRVHRSRARQWLSVLTKEPQSTWQDASGPSDTADDSGKMAARGGPAKAEYQQDRPPHGHRRHPDQADGRANRAEPQACPAYPAGKTCSASGKAARRELPPHHNRAARIDRVNLKHVLGQIQPACSNLLCRWLRSVFRVTARNVACCDAGSGSHPLHQGQLFVKRRQADPVLVNRHAKLTPYRRPNLTPHVRCRNQGLSRRN